MRPANTLAACLAFLILGSCSLRAPDYTAAIKEIPFDPKLPRAEHDDHSYHLTVFMSKVEVVRIEKSHIFVHFHVKNCKSGKDVAIVTPEMANLLLSNFDEVQKVLQNVQSMTINLGGVFSAPDLKAVGPTCIQIVGGTFLNRRMEGRPIVAIVEMMPERAIRGR